MILLAPVKTEKAIGKIEPENALTFRVSRDSTKDSIKEEAEKLFGVKVASVRTHNAHSGEKLAIIKFPKDVKADDIATKLKLIT